MQMRACKPGAALEPYYFNDKGEAVPGTGSKEVIKPYVRFEIRELKGVPTSAVKVWILLLRQWHVARKEWVTIPKRLREEAGISRWALSRGLAALEKEGVIALRKDSGKSSRAQRL